MKLYEYYFSPTGSMEELTLLKIDLRSVAVGASSAPNCEIRPYISKFGPKSDLILRENQTKIRPKIR